jgi:AcrR family transcriptional regulator
MILQKAFELIYTKGYLTTSVDDILATTKVTKGAFYYHFKNKDEMGLAIINDIVRPTMYNAFINPIKGANNPVNAIYDLCKHLLLENPFLKPEYGCPVGNLTQEVSNWTIEFNNALAAIIYQWRNVLIECIDAGKKAGNISKNVNSSQVAYFIMSGYWGVRNFGKLENNTKSFKLFLKELKSYLSTLK